MLPRLLFFILIALAMVFVAKRKGFNPLNWVLAGSIVGFIILLFLPDAREAGIDEEERNRREKTGNLIGLFLSSLVLIFLAIMAGFIFFPTYL